MPEPQPTILCPLCRKPMKLEDFAITVHADQTWTAEPSVVCPHDPCPANFFVDKGRVVFIRAAWETPRRKSSHRK